MINMITYLDIEKGGFPTTYPVEADSFEEAMESVMHTLIAETTNASVNRVLEADEVDKLREEYTTLYEVDRVECEQELEQLKNEKRALEERIKAKYDKLASIMQHVNDNVKTINDGYVVESLADDRSFKAVVDGHVLHYTYVGEGLFKLARVDEVNKNDRSIFALQTANQERFIELFGACFSASKHFVAVDTTEENKTRLIGSKVATTVHTAYADIQRDTILTEEMVDWMVKDENLDSIVIYAETDQEAGV